MNKQTLSFLNRLLGISPGILACYREQVAYWAPEKPPLTVLFGRLGSQIAEDFRSVGDATNDRLMLAIEHAMASDDEELGIAVSTGLIEAMSGTADRLGVWDDIRPRLGLLSAQYHDAWIGGEYS